MTLAFVFPGQGSQSPGMLAELATTAPVVQHTFAEASEVLGYDLWQLCQHGTLEELSVTERTQPAMLTAGVATWRLWQQRGGALPDFMAGHSLGEYTALVCADALAFQTAVDLVRFRGLAMQQAVPQGQGAMAAILGLEEEQVINACAQATQTEVVAAANFNSPGQIVIAGHKAAVERAIELLKAQGAKRALLLPVSVPSHTSLMQPAAQQLAERLRAVPLSMPKIKVISVDLQVPTNVEQVRQNLIEQLVQPVRWTATIQTMLRQGIRTVIECGPGKVLTGLNRRIERNRDIALLSLEDAASFEAALQAVRGV